MPRASRSAWCSRSRVILWRRKTPLPSGQLSNSSRNAKTATPDIPQQKEHLFDAYAFVKLQAHDELDAYYHDPQEDRNPFDIAKKSWIQVSNIRVLKLPAPGTFQADWDETRTDYNTTVSQLTKWRATTKIVNDEATDRNPLGIYIETLDWAQEQSE